jgi:hypothetical protein
MVQDFQFIDGTKHDGATRRLARSHVMKGKNAGRKLNRRSRKEARPSKRQTSSQVSGVSSNNECMWSPILIDTLRFVSFPVDALPESQFVINHCMCITFRTQLGLSN